MPSAPTPPATDRKCQAVVAAPFIAYLANLRIARDRYPLLVVARYSCMDYREGSNPCSLELVAAPLIGNIKPHSPPILQPFNAVTHNRLLRLEIISESQQEHPSSRCSPINALNEARSDHHTIARAAASVPCIVQTNTRMRVQFDNPHDFDDLESSHQSLCVQRNPNRRQISRHTVDAEYSRKCRMDGGVRFLRKNPNSPLRTVLGTFRVSTRPVTSIRNAMYFAPQTLLPDQCAR